MGGELKLDTWLTVTCSNPSRHCVSQSIVFSDYKMVILGALLVLQVVTGAQDAWGGNRDFISTCLDLKDRGTGLKCEGLTCSVDQGRKVGLEELQTSSCSADTECRQDQTNLHCIKGRCQCPMGQALNLTSCACQRAAQCGLGDNNCSQHNGRKCEDDYCSCFISPDYRTLLLDPSSLFCVLPSLVLEELAVIVPPSSSSNVGLTVLYTILGLLCVVLVVVSGVAAHRNCVICEKGDYECETPESELPEVHIAAWDHPSLDYIPRDEEDIVFTLSQAKDTVRMSNASTIHVMDEERTAYGLPEDEHDNMAYVDDDDPRHD